MIVNTKYVDAQITIQQFLDATNHKLDEEIQEDLWLSLKLQDLCTELAMFTVTWKTDVEHYSTLYVGTTNEDGTSFGWVDSNIDLPKRVIYFSERPWNAATTFFNNFVFINIEKEWKQYPDMTYQYSFSTDNPMLIKVNLK